MSGESRHLSFSLSCRSRSKGDSLIRVLAYALRTEMTNTRTGVTYNYAQKGGLVAYGKIGWDGSLEGLGAAASSAEKRHDAVEAREIIAALPHELDVDACNRLLRSLADDPMGSGR